MIKIGFNKCWEFTLQNSFDEFSTFGFIKYTEARGGADRFLDHNNWQRVDLPHDWALSLKKDPSANCSEGAYPSSFYNEFTLERRSNIDQAYNLGWYRKTFSYDPSWVGKRIFIEFEGVFRDATVWVNGVYLDRHNSGYTSFALELTDHLVEGEENSIAVRVDCEQTEGWWYEGAGIYRNVNLLVGGSAYFKYNKTFVTADTDGKVKVRSVLVNDTPETFEDSVLWNIVDGEGKTVASAKTSVSIAPYGESEVCGELLIESPHLWDIDDPYLYHLNASVGEEQESLRFGLRSVVLDPDRGLILNGVPRKIRGACVHQDFGGVGVALTDNLQAYKIQRLKEMGVNAYRTAHHAPAPALLDACDELGMLIMDETRLFGTSPEAVRQLTDLIERDRNHPCVFIWSLGNEEFPVQNEEWGFRLLEKAKRIAKTLDPTRLVTYGGANGPDFVGANRAADVRGVNYIRIGDPGWLDKYHKEHPEQPIIGTEESSYVISRGGVENDLERGLLDSFGTVTMSWGSTPKGWVKYTENRDYFAGGFMWTGFDYRGEPNPFHYRNCISSFGTIDLCGMEKPPFYYYKAWWLDEPILKLAPHWNHEEGRIVTVAVYTNCESITLSLNGEVLETKTVERFDSPLFRVPFKAGVLSVEGVRHGKTYRDELVTSGAAAEVRCSSVLDIQKNDDVGIYELNAYDADGLFCPIADEYVELTGENCEIVGVGNGDPASYDYERKPEAEDMVLIDSFEEDGQKFTVPQKIKNILSPREDKLVFEPKEQSPCYDDDFRIISQLNVNYSPDKERTFTAEIDGVDGYEYIEFERLGGKASVYLNGELLGDNTHLIGGTIAVSRAHRFYGKFIGGKNIIKVVFDQSATDTFIMSGYVKVGRQRKEPWQVRLHYGKARVFVKSATPEEMKLNVKLK